MDERATEPKPTMPSTLSVEWDEDPNIKGASTLLQDLINTVRKDVDIDCLSTAVLSLQDVITEGTYNGDDLAIVHLHLITALLTRYGLFGWIEDMDACWEQCFKGIEPERVIKAVREKGDGDIVEVQVAVELIKACRSSMNTDTVNTMICIATETFSSYVTDKVTPQIAALGIFLGKALVMRYLACGDASDLNEATEAFQRTQLICMADTTLANIYLTCLSHIEWLQFREFGDFERIQLAEIYRNQSIAIDESGIALSDIGAKIVMEAVDDAQLQNGIELLAASVQSRLGPHPRRLHSLGHLANAYYKRFVRQGQDDLADLEECIVLYRDALILRPQHHPRRSLSLIRLADALQTRYQRKGTFQDLEESIAHYQELLDLRMPPHLDRLSILTGLANAMFTRFEIKGAFPDLEESILLYGEAVGLKQPDQQDHLMLLNDLANALFTRFRHNGTFQDLEESITLHRRALNVQFPYHSTSLSHLANTISTRFEILGDYQDLEESISLHREALGAASPPQHRTVILANLANALVTRFRHKGIFQDLNESITLYRDALEMQPSPCSDHTPLMMNNLANALATRFENTDVLKDLEDCITLYRKVLDTQPPPNPERSTTLNNLANALSARFRYMEVFQDLEECISLYRQALDLQPLHYLNHSSLLDNLANALSTRFERGGPLQDIEESISLHREVLNLRPSPHPHRSLALSNLANALWARLDRGDMSQEEDIRNTFECFQEAVKYPTGSLLQRLEDSKRWASFARKHCPASILDVYDYSMALLPQLASLDLTLQQRRDVLQHTRHLVGNAAKCAIDGNKCDAAVTFLSTGRSVFWSQALQLRTPVDELMISHPAMAEKLVSISRQLESASYSKNAPISDSSPSRELNAGTSQSLHLLANQRQQVIDEIRSTPGYERFLLPPSFSSLQAVANDKLVILLNGSTLGCDALIMHRAGPVQRVRLPDVCFDILETMDALTHTKLRAGTSSIEIPQDAIDVLRQLLTRDMVPETSIGPDEVFRLTLAVLWVTVVHPIINALEIKKTESPRRIWWCPAGPFASLPIHAAGIYSEDSEPIDCLFQYAVSSYCNSPQDLLHPPPKITQSFKLTAIIEPEAPGAAVLPATHAELTRIEQHMPDRQCLITHIGSEDSPNRLDDIISDIQKSSFVHFGCHGMQNLKDPLESCLLLSGGKLTMSHLIKECRVLEGALAYLSACETAKGDEVRPDESLNLVATMMFTGFRSVIGTMWSIFDEDAPIVADVFYRYLFRNGNQAPPDVRDAAYGLHLATKELRDRGKPFINWVPYVHYGI